MRAYIAFMALSLLSLAGLFAGEGVVGRASVLVERYGSVPGGVVLESTAAGFEPLSSVAYDRKTNTFTLNGAATYACPVGGREFRDLLVALEKDDRVGVSLNREYGKYIYFGEFGRSSKLAETLVEADKFLTGVIFAIPEGIGDRKLPAGFQPRAPESRPTNIVGCVNFTNFRFAKKPGASQYVRAGFSMDVILMPVRKEKTAEGGHISDEESLKAGLIADEDRANAKRLEELKDEFTREVELVGRTVSYGEAAAFARLLRDSKLDLKALAKQF